MSVPNTKPLAMGALNHAVNGHGLSSLAHFLCLTAAANGSCGDVLFYEDFFNKDNVLDERERDVLYKQTMLQLL